MRAPALSDLHVDVAVDGGRPRAPGRWSGAPAMGWCPWRPVTRGDATSRANCTSRCSTGRGGIVRLNRYGRLFRTHVEDALRSLQAGYAAVADATGPDQGEVTLAFLPSLGPTLIPALVRKFRMTYPGSASCCRRAGRRTGSRCPKAGRSISVSPRRIPSARTSSGLHYGQRDWPW